MNETRGGRAGSSDVGRGRRMRRFEDNRYRSSRDDSHTKKKKRKISRSYGLSRQERPRPHSQRRERTRRTTMKDIRGERGPPIRRKNDRRDHYHPRDNSVVWKRNERSDCRQRERVSDGRRDRTSKGEGTQDRRYYRPRGEGSDGKRPTDERERTKRVMNDAKRRRTSEREGMQAWTIDRRPVMRQASNVAGTASTFFAGGSRSGQKRNNVTTTTAHRSQSLSMVETDPNRLKRVRRRFMTYPGLTGARENVALELTRCLLVVRAFAATETARLRKKHDRVYEFSSIGAQEREARICVR